MNSDFTAARAAIEKMYQRYESHRHRCEVKYVANLPSRERRVRYVEEVELIRGPEAALRLRADATTAFNSRKAA